MSSEKKKPRITIKKVINNQIEEKSSFILEDELRKNLSKTQELIRQSKYSDLDESIVRLILNRIDDNVIACEEAEVDKIILTKVKHNYYEIKDIILRQQSKKLDDKFKEYEKRISNNEKKNDEYIKETKEKIDNIGYNILSIIIAFTIGSTLVTAIDKISTIYIPLFVIGTIWLMLTLMVFINGMFNKNDFNNKQSTFMYVIFSILTIIALIYTFTFTSNNKDIIPLCDNEYIKSEE